MIFRVLARLFQHRIAPGRAAAVALAACAGLAAEAPIRTAAAQSFTGDFLAARYAEARRDFRSAARFWRRALGYEPQNPGLMERAVIYGTLAGEPDLALPAALRLHAAVPRSRDARLLLIADAFRDERYDDAQALMVESPDLVMTGLLRSLLSGWAAVGSGEAEDVEALMLGDEPGPLEAVYGGYHVGLMAAIAGDHARAVTAYQGAREAAGGWTPRLGRAAVASLAADGRVDEAQALLEELLAMQPGDQRLISLAAALSSGDAPALLADSTLDGAAEAFHGLASAIGADTPDAAQTALFYAQVALHLRPDFAEAQLLAGDLLFSLERNDAAAAMFARVAVDAPERRLAQLGRAQALSEAGRVGEALTALREIADAPDASPRVFFTLGRLLTSVEAYADCAAAYEDGVARLGQLEERHWVALFGAGICHERVGHWDAAEARFRGALELRPGQPDVLNYLGYSLVEQRRRLDEALTMIEEAVAARPDSGHIVDSLGWALFRLGDFDGAVVHLERAAELEPNISVINDHLGDALWMVGRRMEARFQWRRALSFESESPEAEDRIIRKLEIGLDRVLAEEAEAADTPVEAADRADDADAAAPATSPEDGEAEPAEIDDETRLTPPSSFGWSQLG